MIVMIVISSKIYWWCFANRLFVQQVGLETHAVTAIVTLLVPPTHVLSYPGVAIRWDQCLELFHAVLRVPDSGLKKINTNT